MKSKVLDTTKPVEFDYGAPARIIDVTDKRLIAVRVHSDTPTPYQFDLEGNGFSNDSMLQNRVPSVENGGLKLLEPEDIPPGSCICYGEHRHWWFQVVCVRGKHVVVLDEDGEGMTFSYDELLENDCRILRPGAKGWAPCHKVLIG
jgi:hypothetical protein